VDVEGTNQRRLRFLLNVVSAAPYGVEHLTAAKFSENSRSKRVVEKAGFTFTKHMPQAYEKNGVKIDADLYEYHVTK
jgi:RimJ/RimL family protein N-acetyltransferase